MNQVYIVMVDYEGMMRPTYMPRIAFFSREKAQAYIEENTDGSVVCGGYKAKIISIPIDEAV